jgi:hypothetical protein
MTREYRKHIAHRGGQVPNAGCVLSHAWTRRAAARSRTGPALSAMRRPSTTGGLIPKCSTLRPGSNHPAGTRTVTADACRPARQEARRKVEFGREGPRSSPQRALCSLQSATDEARQIRGACPAAFDTSARQPGRSVQRNRSFLICIGGRDVSAAMRAGHVALACLECSHFCDSDETITFSPYAEGDHTRSAVRSPATVIRSSFLSARPPLRPLNCSMTGCEGASGAGQTQRGWAAPGWTAVPQGRAAP